MDSEATDATQSQTGLPRAILFDNLAITEPLLEISTAGKSCSMIHWHRRDILAFSWLFMAHENLLSVQEGARYRGIVSSRDFLLFVHLPSNLNGRRNPFQKITLVDTVVVCIIYPAPYHAYNRVDRVLSSLLIVPCEDLWALTSTDEKTGNERWMRLTIMESASLFPHVYSTGPSSPLLRKIVPSEISCQRTSVRMGGGQRPHTDLWTVAAKRRWNRRDRIVDKHSDRFGFGVTHGKRQMSQCRQPVKLFPVEVLEIVGVVELEMGDALKKRKQKSSTSICPR
ncbi:hypothetical protein C8J56DRAFT_902633 [Mycena floridula]|nr:hypothetical protein C8J56DRAFT_902633 [Mycena floridula]